MLRDIVVDTNVFVHASNPGVSYYNEAKNLVATLERSPTSLCVDEGFDTDQARNRSKIGCEYLTHLQIGMLAFALVQKLAATSRVRVVSSRVEQRVQRQINQNIAKPSDRTFLKVAINSQDHFLCSHDFEHFSERKRVMVKNLFDVRVKTAGETLLIL